MVIIHGVGPCIFARMNAKATEHQPLRGNRNSDHFHRPEFRSAFFNRYNMGVSIIIKLNFPTLGIIRDIENGVGFCSAKRVELYTNSNIG